MIIFFLIFHSFTLSFAAMGIEATKTQELERVPKDCSEKFDSTQGHYKNPKLFVITSKKLCPTYLEVCKKEKGVECQWEGYKVKGKYEPKKAFKFRQKLKVIPKDCRHAVEINNEEFIKKFCNLKKTRPVGESNNLR